MKTDAPIAPVRKRIVVRASQGLAFDVFTTGIARWWPKASHTILKAPLAEVIIEPHVGGRWFQRGEDGSECDTGRVLAWAPPERLVLSWQLNGRWQFEPAIESEVEVRFNKIDAETTEVELEHRLLERFGDTANALRAGVDGENGWPLLLKLFAAYAAAE
jgi:uncharacterized protein YndB with AHSA1/START domain